MAIRVVHDARGVEWRVWAVRPSWSGRHRMHDDSGELRPLLAPDLAGGWLTFESTAGERRRVVPIPEGWDALDDEALERLFLAARPQPRPHRRRLVE